MAVRPPSIYTLALLETPLKLEGSFRKEILKVVKGLKKVR